jgi:pyruvate dehydrogenase E2 component (dihydrolipoamide acetyltransferase)
MAMSELKLPELGEGVHEGELVKWLVKVGDVVKDDQPVCEIMTDKATVELPSPFHGKVTALNAKEGETVKVGQTMLSYEGTSAAKQANETSAAKQANETSAAKQASAPTSHAPTAPVAYAPAPVAVGAMAASAAPAALTAGNGGTVSIGGHVQAAPSTRRFARESGVDITRVSASGPAGRVMREDVERFLTGTGTGAVAAGTATPVVARSAGAWGGNLEERVPFKGLRKKISEKMRLSKDKAAHFTYVEEADATALVELRNQAKEMASKQGIKITYLPFVMKAMVAAAKQFPVLNASYDETTQELVYKKYFNIGLSVQTDDGLTAPVIKNVESKSILQIAQEIQNVVDRARAKKLTMDDLTGGTITLTNAGSIGGLFATPVINYPEVAIVGLNKIFRKPVVRTVNGREEIVIRDWTYFSISLDHRVVDGAIAAEFMKVMIRYIENPSLLVLEA